ncbi:MAG: hypothetical protein HRT88_23965 [Lentisphaeraceae bacterium]|nr:hypothetical protein [Lentisphaeraceae bacterium]
MVDFIVLVVSGGSKKTLDKIKEGAVYAATYQPPERDGALALYVAVQWLSGKKVPALIYMPVHIITAIDVDEYYPAQF